MLKNKTSLKAKNRKDLIYYCLMMALPVLQFCVFWIGVNINAILLAFQKYDFYTNTYTWDVIGCMKEAFETIGSIEGFKWKNSIIIYLVGLVVSTPLTLFFSYYIAKQKTGTSCFKVFLYLPNVISGVVFSTIWIFFAERAIPTYLDKLLNIKIDGLIENVDTRFMAILLFGMFTGFGGGVLMYSNAMSAISPDIIEAANLDGATGIKEFWYITLPLIYPTLSIMIATGVGGIFLSDIGLYLYFGGGAPAEMQTFSYMIMVDTLTAEHPGDYAKLASIGLITTFVVAPMVFGAKYLFKKFGPSTVD